MAIIFTAKNVNSYKYLYIPEKFIDPRLFHLVLLNWISQKVKKIIESGISVPLDRKTGN